MGYEAHDLAGNLVIISMCSASISTISSGAILTMILRSDRGLSKLYHRIMFGLCIADIFSSSAISFGTIPMPVGTEDAWKALGNQASCNAQGFFYLIGSSAAPMYICSLCFYYYMSIHHRMTEEEIVTMKIERFLHIVPILFSLSMGVLALSLRVLNPDIGWCRTQSKPRKCDLNGENDNDEDGGNSSSVCHGKHARTVRLLAIACSTWTSIIIIFYLLTFIYCKVKNQEERSASYNFPSPTASARSRNPSPASRTRKVFVRAISYVIALLLTYVPAFVSSGLVRYGDNLNKPIFIIASFLYPLQGFYNCLIFIHTRVTRHRLRRNLTYLQAVVFTFRTYGRSEEDGDVQEAEEIEAFGVYERIKRRSLSIVHRFQQLILPGHQNRGSSNSNNSLQPNPEIDHEQAPGGGPNVDDIRGGDAESSFQQSTVRFREDKAASSRAYSIDSTESRPIDGILQQ